MDGFLRGPWLSLLLIALALSSFALVDAASVTVRVALGQRHPISPYLYGVNFATPTMLQWGVGANRQSGDASSKYNWKLDATNSADDNYWRTASPYRPFQPPTPANTSFLDLMLTRTVQAGSVFINPVQALGWVTNTTKDCFSFPVSVYGPQQRASGDAGNGVYPNGTQLTSDWHCFRPYGVGDNVEWLSHMESLVGREALQRQFWLQTLDNEPDCFNPVHRDVHPLMFGYDELWALTAGFGAIAKQLYPNMVLNGPSWSNYCWWYFVRGDGCGGTDGTDFRQHGSEYTMPWLLRRLDEYYRATGVRLLDTIDFHHYPSYPVQVPGRDDTPAEQQAILDSVRTLWDWTYVDPGDLGHCGARCMGPAPAILPRMVGEVREFAPSMGLRFTVSEYAFGFNDSCYTGALATAEALALYGYWDVYMSGRWLSPAEGSHVEQAFKLFLNVDGQGAKVLGDSVNTTSSSSPNQTAYSIHDPRRQLLYVLLFNRDLDARGSSSFSVTVDDARFSDGQKQQTATVYTMTPQDWQVAPRLQATVTATAAGNGLSFTQAVPPRSLAMVVVPAVTLADGVREVHWQPHAGPSLASRHAALLEAEAQHGKLSAEQKQRYSQAGLRNRPTLTAPPRSPKRSHRSRAEQ